jgi:hypothetical protein
MRAKHDRDRLIATMTPLEIAEHDLAAIIETDRLYKAGELSVPVTESNTRAMEQHIADRRADVDRLRGTQP